MITYFDIETLPADSEAVIKRLREKIKAPATYKKQESIDKWMEENIDAALEEVVKKTSFDGAYGRIACIAWASDDLEVTSSSATESECGVIERFYDYVSECSFSEIFCGQNIHAFDLPFLKHRSIINGIKPPKIIEKAMNAKPWDECIADTKLMWSTDKNKQISLDTLCFILGIDGKGDFNGSLVAETWPIDPQKVIDYCKHDVEITRQVYKKLTFRDPF